MPHTLAQFALGNARQNPTIAARARTETKRDETLTHGSSWKP